MKGHGRPHRRSCAGALASDFAAAMVASMASSRAIGSSGINAGHVGARTGISSLQLSGSEQQLRWLLAGVTTAGCSQWAVVTAGKHPKDLPQFGWINTLLSNHQTSLSGNFHAFNGHFAGLRQ